MAWLQVGMVVKVTGIPVGDGTTFDTPPMLLTQVATDYDESKQDASVQSRTVRAFAWSTT